MSINTDFDTDISSDPALAALDFDDIVIPQDDEPEAAPTIVEVKDPEVEAMKAQQEQKADKPQPVVGSLNPEGANSSSNKLHAADNFLGSLPEEQQQKIKAKAPSIADSMIDDDAYRIEFGRQVMEKLDTLSKRLLEEQKDISVPEAESIMKNIIRELDGFQHKYNDPGKLAQFLQAVKNKARDSKERIEARRRDMQIDAMNISEKMEEAVSKLQDTETRLRENAARGKVMRETTIETMRKMVQVLATLEEVVNIASERAERIRTIKDAAEVNGDGAPVIFDGKYYTVQEFRVYYQKYAEALGEIQRTWLSWRQQFFLSRMNIESSTTIINTSLKTLETCQMIRKHAVPAARHQLVTWQQALDTERAAKTNQAVVQDINKLISNAFQQTASMAESAAEINNATLIDLSTIDDISASLQKVYDTLGKQQEDGVRKRAESFAKIRKAEADIEAAKDAYHNRQVQTASMIISGQAPTSGGGSSSTETGDDFINSL